MRYGERHGLDDDQAVRQWAVAAATFEHAPQLEPYVGSVKGMGCAFLAYLRMMSGADALTPDRQVRDGLNVLGFVLAHDDEHTTLVVAHAAATEIGIQMLTLDRLVSYPSR